MRMILYILIVVLTLFAPVVRLDIAKLSPVEAVAIYMENGSVVLKTDEENQGIGTDAVSALRDLKEKAPAIIYLDTARYLLIGTGAEDAAEQLRKHLKPTIQIGVYKGGDVKEEAKYLDVHADAAGPEA